MIEYLHSKGIEIVYSSGNESVLSECPFCGKQSDRKKHHTYFNEEKQVIHCKVCNKGANLYKLKQYYGDLEIKKGKKEIKRNGKVIASWDDKDLSIPYPQMNISKDIINNASKLLFEDKGKVALDYLNSRGFSNDILRKYKIGVIYQTQCPVCKKRYMARKKCPVCENKTKIRQWFISIPYFYKNELQLVKYRSIPPAEKQFLREKGGVTGIYNLDNLNLKKSERVFFCEAEFDALSLIQLGYENVVSLSSGASSWEIWYNQFFTDADVIYLVLDNDKAGDSGAKRIAEKLGAFRCKRIKLPQKDVNDFLINRGTKADFDDILSSADFMGKKLWLSAGDLEDDLIDLATKKDKAKGYTLKWDGLNKTLGGMRNSELTIITGDTGSGKSLFTSALALDVAEIGLPVVIGSFEITPQDTIQRILHQSTGLNWKDLSNDINVLKRAIRNLNILPMNFLNVYGAIDLKALEEVLLWGLKKYGIKLIILDHLHYFLKDAGTENERYSIEQTVRQLKRWTLEWGVHIVLVVHPNSRLTRSGRVALNALKGSSEIKKEADNVLSVYRARGYERHPDRVTNSIGATEIRILKCRSPFGKEGVFWLKFNMDNLIYQDMTIEEENMVLYMDYDAIEQTENKGGVFDKKKAKDYMKVHNNLSFDNKHNTGKTDEYAEVEEQEEDKPF